MIRAGDVFYPLGRDRLIAGLGLVGFVDRTLTFAEAPGATVTLVLPLPESTSVTLVLLVTVEISDT